MTRAGRTQLSRERVLDAAVRLVDEQGIGALTMRRLASELGVGAMSLYHYLPAKQSLLDGVVEVVIGEILAADGGQPTDTWHATVRRRFLAARAAMLQHPWLPELLSSSRQPPPAVYGYYEWILGTLIDAGFSYALGHKALHALGSLPLGYAQEIFRPLPEDQGLDPAAAEQEFAQMASLVPHLAAMVERESHAATDPTLGWCDGQVEFEFTLDLILGGLERLRVAGY